MNTTYRSTVPWREVADLLKQSPLPESLALVSQIAHEREWATTGQTGGYHVAASSPPLMTFYAGPQWERTVVAGFAAAKRWLEDMGCDVATGGDKDHPYLLVCGRYEEAP